jgi:hypothetical protein
MFSRSFKVLSSIAAVSVAACVSAEDVSRQQVPAAVLNAFDKAYPGAQDVEYEREVKNGTTYFEIDFEDEAGNDMEVVYNENGGVMSTDVD